MVDDPKPAPVPPVLSTVEALKWLPDQKQIPPAGGKEPSSGTPRFRALPPPPVKPK
jgi:hypothetical protein